MPFRFAGTRRKAGFLLSRAIWYSCRAKRKDGIDMGIPRQTRDPMTAEEFFAFTETRPNEEKWELLEGEPVLSASATRLHQRIVGNLHAALKRLEQQQKRSGVLEWEVLPGMKINVPVPDLLIRPFDDLQGAECADVIVAFEVLSSSTADLDLHWKRDAYAGLPSLQTYVVVAQDAVDVLIYDRAIEAALDLSVLSLSVPLTDIYLDTGLDSP
jgi:Uma2 family endonuclease